MNNIIQIAIRGFDRNFSYFVHDGQSRDIAIVDPGDLERLEELIAAAGWRPKAIWLTHSHYDHIQGVAPLVARYDIPVYLHEAAADRIDVPLAKMVKLRDGDKIGIGSLSGTILATPGHIDDAICFYFPETATSDGKPKVITGDTLFIEGCGRADLEDSNVEDLWASLRRLADLPAQTEVYPGHDYGSKPVSTIAWELAHNKYLLCADFVEFRSLRLPKS